MQTDLRLFQLISPSLPIGGFTYSQGLEWAVEFGWIQSSEQFQAWLESQLDNALVSLELPMLRYLMLAIKEEDWDRFDKLSRELIAWRETKEFRLEEIQRGKALARLLPELEIHIPDGAQAALQRSQLAGMALAAVHWGIPADKLALGYLWSWLENAVMAGVKLVPLGQTQGQQLLARMAPSLVACVERSAQVGQSEMGSTSPALAIASSRHEQQYTRLFRS